MYGMRNTKQAIRKNKPPIKLIMSPFLILDIMKKIAEVTKRIHPKI